MPDGVRERYVLCCEVQRGLGSTSASAGGDDIAGMATAAEL